MAVSSPTRCGTLEKLVEWLNKGLMAAWRPTCAHPSTRARSLPVPSGTTAAGGGGTPSKSGSASTSSSACNTHAMVPSPPAHCEPQPH
eukprot:7498009-Pyramimonas_sp.AAC.2